MKTKTIKQQIHFETGATDIYNAIMDADKHSEFTGATATMDPKVGGKFTAFDGYISGTNIELTPSTKIVQSWKAVEDGWPDDHYSTVTFDIVEENDGTTLYFTHTDVPEETVESITTGWTEFYWEPLKALFL